MEHSILEELPWNDQSYSRATLEQSILEELQWNDQSEMSSSGMLNPGRAALEQSILEEMHKKNIYFISFESFSQFSPLFMIKSEFLPSLFSPSRASNYSFAHIK